MYLIYVKKENADETGNWEEKCRESGGIIGGRCTEGIPSHCSSHCSCSSNSFVEVINIKTGEKVEKASSFRILKDNECFDCRDDSQCQEQKKDSWCQEGVCYKKFE